MANHQTPTPLSKNGTNNGDLTKKEETIQKLYERFKTELTKPLEDLEKSIGQKNIYDWAVETYIWLNAFPTNIQMNSLNSNRKKCLQVLYDLVDEWEKDWEKYGSNEFEKAIPRIFGTENIRKIIRICMPMDKAQSLYKMKVGTKVGMPWYSKISEFDSKEDKDEWFEYVKKFPETRPTMNKRLYKLIKSEHIGLKNDEDLIELLKPTKVPEVMPIVAENRDPYKYGGNDGPFYIVWNPRPGVGYY